MAHTGARRLCQAPWLPPPSLLLLQQQQQLQPLPLLEGPDAVYPDPFSETKGGDSLALSRTSSFQTPPPLLLGKKTWQRARQLPPPSWHPVRGWAPQPSLWHPGRDKTPLPSHAPVPYSSWRPGR